MAVVISHRFHETHLTHVYKLKILIVFEIESLEIFKGIPYNNNIHIQVNHFHGIEPIYI